MSLGVELLGCLAEVEGDLTDDEAAGGRSEILLGNINDILKQAVGRHVMTSILASLRAPRAMKINPTA